MTDGMPPAANGTEQRLDVLIGRLDRLVELLTPSPPAAPSDPADGETIELTEPAAANPKTRKSR